MHKPKNLRMNTPLLDISDENHIINLKIFTDAPIVSMYHYKYGLIYGLFYTKKWKSFIELETLNSLRKCYLHKLENKKLADYILKEKDITQNYTAAKLTNKIREGVFNNFIYYSTSLKSVRDIKKYCTSRYFHCIESNTNIMNNILVDIVKDINVQLDYINDIENKISLVDKNDIEQWHELVNNKLYDTPYSYNNISNMLIKI